MGLYGALRLERRSVVNDSIYLMLNQESSGRILRLRTFPAIEPVKWHKPKFNVVIGLNMPTFAGKMVMELVKPAQHSRTVCVNFCEIVAV